MLAHSVPCDACTQSRIQNVPPLQLHAPVFPPRCKSSLRVLLLRPTSCRAFSTQNQQQQLQQQHRLARPAGSQRSTTTNSSRTECSSDSPSQRGTDAHAGALWSVPVTVTGHCRVTFLGIAAGLVIWAGGIMPAYALNTGSPLQVCPTSPEEQVGNEGTAGTRKSLVAELAGALDLFKGNGKEPTDPFTLYGTVTKLYAIEKRDGNKIMSRRKGFTATACVAVSAAAQETPQFQGLSAAERVEAIADATCKSTEGPELRPACATSCQTACEAALGRYAQSSQEFTGYPLDEQARGRVLRGCERQCVAECEKPGLSTGFAVPYRR